MPDKERFPRYIFGLHEPGGESLMEKEEKIGWIVFTHGLGHNPNDRNGHDYRRWSDRGFGIIARLNHGYGAAGTIPLPQHYDAFAQRVRNFVANSKGGRIWVIGNEMNHGQERPEGQLILPDQYATCYKKCRDQVHALPGHEDDQVAIGAVAPWNNTTSYPGNENGDWVQYYVDILNAIRSLNCPIDAITLHTYTHGQDPRLVFSKQKMSPPFQRYHFHFLCYQDFMKATPQELRRLPVYITETDQDDPWENANRGWVQNAYQEINDWNTTAGNQQIRALVLYRWPKFDKWYIEGKTGVHNDMRAAMQHEYVWRDTKPPVQINGHTIQGAFLEYFETMGEEHTGRPISNEVVEDGLKTQYFESLVLQQDLSGKIRLKAAGTEVQMLRQAVRTAQNESQALKTQVRDLERQVQTLMEQAGHPLGPGTEPGTPVEQISEVVQPMWDPIVYELPRHATKRYAMREMGTIKYLVVHHSAVPGTVSAQKIAQFHVKNMQWPGIGYHFYINDQGRVAQVNDLTTVCYHVGKHDPAGIGICVGGNFTKEIPTAAQLKSTAHLIAWLLQELDLPLDAVKGKKEFIDTQSPGHQWLTGKKWKNLLLAEIKKAQQEQRKSHPVKSFYHYVLFWQTLDGWAEEDWQGAQTYIGRFRVTHGFSVDDAIFARFVTIVGGPLGVDKKAEQILLDAGCRVERIAGKSPAETSRLLTEMAQRGQRFQSFAG